MEVVPVVEIAKNTHEVIEILNIGGSTLRKWCIALEDNGYVFTRVEQKKRLFYQNDIDMLQHFKVLVQDHKMQLDQASKVVIPKFQKVEDEPLQEGTPNVPAKEEPLPQRTTLVTVDVLEQMKNELKLEFQNQLEQQEQKFEQILEQRLEQRDLKLTMTMKAELEQRQAEIATAKEEQASAKKKSFWSRLFKK